MNVTHRACRVLLAAAKRRVGSVKDCCEQSSNYKIDLSFASSINFCVSSGTPITSCCCGVWNVPCCCCAENTSAGGIPLDVHVMTASPGHQDVEAVPDKSTLPGRARPVSLLVFRAHRTLRPFQTSISSLIFSNWSICSLENHTWTPSSKSVDINLEVICCYENVSD